MRCLFAAVIGLLLWIGLAGAQPIPVPQGCNAPQVPSGFDASGTITCRQLNFPLDLSFAGIFGLPTTAQTQAEVNLGNIVLVLDTDPGYKTDYTVEITTPQDVTPFMIGVIQKIDTTSGQTVITVAVFRSQGGGIYNSWNLKVIGGPTFSIPASGALAVDSTDSFALPNAGTTLSLTLDTGKLFTAGSQVYMQALADGSTSLFGVIENYNSATGAATLYVTNSTGTGLTYQLWTVALTGNLAPFVPILGFSNTSLTFGSSAGQIGEGQVVTLTTQTGLLLNNSHIVVSSSTDSTQYFRGIGQYNSGTGSITVYITDVSGSGTFSSWSLFAQDGPPVNAAQIAVSKTSLTIGAGDTSVITVQSGQNFPIQGPVTLTALADQTKQMLGIIKAYSGTSMIVTVTATYGSGTFSAWSILNTGPPQTRISLYQMNGLQIISNAGFSVSVTGGSIRDSTDTVDLFSNGGTVSFSTPGVIVAAPLAGTVASSGTAVTGTGTTFTSDFGSSLTDLFNQISFAYHNVTPSGLPSIIATSSTSVSVQTVTNDLSLTTGEALGASGAGFTRGGTLSSSTMVTGDTIYVGVYVALNASTGATLLGASAMTPSGAPDLPSGYTYYRVIGLVTLTKAGVSSFWQPLVAAPYVNNNNNIGSVLVQASGPPASLAAIQWGQVNLASTNAVTGTLGATNGGTGVSNPTAHGIMIGEGSSPMNSIGPCNANVPVTGQGGSSDPQCGGIIPTANGGTGNSSGTATPTPHSVAPTAVYSGTITPTALGINESSCNTTTGVVTFASSFAAALTASGQSVVLTGTVSSGYTTGQAYYVNIASNTTLTTWTNYTDAVNGSGASQVKCTVNNNAGWSLRYFAYTNVFNVGLSTIAPIGATPGSTTMGFDFNLTNAVAAATSVGFSCLPSSIFTSAGASNNTWVLKGGPPATAANGWSVAATNLIQIGTTGIVNVGGTTQGTWTQQSTNAFGFSCQVWGALDDPIPANDNDLIEKMVA